MSKCIIELSDFVFPLANNGLLFLNDHANLILCITTIVLVIITARYAKATSSMVEIMSKQIVSEITVSNLVLANSILDKDFVDGRSTNKKGETESHYKEQHFYLSLTIKNRSQATGSIESPELKIQANQYIINCKPLTKQEAFTIKGGETIKECIHYSWSPHGYQETKNISNLDDVMNTLSQKNHNVNYYICYTDNLGKEHECIIEKVISEKDMDKQEREVGKLSTLQNTVD